MEGREKRAYYLFVCKNISLMLLAMCGFTVFLYRGIQFHEFSPFKVALLLFLPYGFYSAFTSLRRSASRFQFDKGCVAVTYIYGVKRYTTLDITAIDLFSNALTIDLVLLDDKKKKRAQMTRSKSVFKEYTLIRKAAELTGIVSLK